MHKDLKPANVLVNPATGQIWLTGFGIASRLPREHAAPAPPDLIAGTFAYMAPEQTGRMNRSIDSRSDLYSLGVLFYEMLTGVLPFSASDPMEWIHCHIARQPAPPNERVPGIPDPVAAIVMKLLAKNAEDRYQTAAGVEADLRRCLTEWELRQCIDPFPLAENDASDRLRIPEKLYGREAEIDSLVAAFDRVVTVGTTELVLISGYAGIGKSSIVNELHKVLVPSRSLFAAGKFDQYKRNIPYATLAQAFQSLVGLLLTKDDFELGRWRSALLEALGPNGQIMVNLIPDLALIIGEQPPVPELPPQEGQNRFQRVFRRFLGVFAQPEHPLALFLDDLQWLDTASLELLEHLATHPEVRHVLLIGAYRDNEVGPSHALPPILNAIREAGGRLHEIVLAPLTSADVRQLVADSLHCSRETAAPLAELIHEKTDGNPFFAIQFLTALVEEELLRFDRSTASWTWDMPRIHRKGFTDNVVDLMAAKLARLSSDSQSALAQLACFGHSVDLDTIISVHGCTEEQIDGALDEAMGAGLVFRAGGAYKFLHDRVQEAAYGPMRAERKVEEHLLIGRALAARMAETGIEDTVFNVANHLNHGMALITSPEERERFVELNAMAGKRAKNSTAYASARDYLARAAAMLPSDTWTRRYADTFELYLAFSECEYLVGNFAAADEMFGMMLDRARFDADRAKVYSLRIKLYQVAGKYDDGLVVALDALRYFGLSLPDTDDEIRAAIETQFREIPVNLCGRPIGELIDAPVATDPSMRAIIDLLVDAAPCAYIGRPSLFPLIALEAVNRSMRHGNTDQSSFAYAIYAIMLVSIFGDIASAFQYSEMSLELNEKFNNARLRGTLLHLHGDHINFWRRHIATDLPILERAFAACLEVGDLVYAGFLAFETVWQLIEKGDVLDDVLAQSARYAAFAQQSHNDAVYETIRLEQQFIAGLGRGKTDPLSFSDDTFDEAACFAALVKATFGCGIVFYHIMKQILAYLYGRHAQALDSAAAAEPVLGAAMGMPIEATYHFYHALTLTALYPTASVVQQEHYRRLLDEKLKKLKVWADNSPENYHNRHALVSAEVARVEGRDSDAMHLYEDAVRSAHEHGFIQNAALANELAGRFFAGRGLETIADAYLRNARSCYLRWGANGKVKQLDQLYPRLIPTDGHSSTATIGSSVQHLDIASVVKASQAVSSEILLPKLIERLMKIALEYAGADRGLLILPAENDHFIRAEAQATGDQVNVIPCHKSIIGTACPESLVRYVIRTHECVILDDAFMPNLFSGDDYLRGRKSRSILCLPLIKQRELTGILFLENTLTSHAFTADRIAILELLAAQAAISLENTRLYSDLQEREAKVRRLVDSNIIGIFIWGNDGQIIDANEAFLRIVEYSRDDLVSGRLSWKDLTPAEWSHVSDLGVADLNAIGTAQPYEKEYFRKNGSRVPVLVGAAKFEEGSDEGVAFVLDLTSSKRAEEVARESERRYREIQMELAHANRVATIGQLSSSIAHEINQPLSGVITNAETALLWLQGETPNIGQALAGLARIVRDGRRVNDVLGRIRAMIKKAPSPNDKVDINDAILEVIGLTHVEAIKNGVVVQTKLGQELPIIEGDKIQLQQVILNLTMNAIEAMSAVGGGPKEVLISTANSELDGVIVGVRDSGSALTRRTSNASLTLSTPPRPTAWGWGYRFAARSLKSMEASCGRSRAFPVGPSSSSPCPLNQASAWRFSALRSPADLAWGWSSRNSVRRRRLPEATFFPEASSTRLAHGVVGPVRPSKSIAHTFGR